MYAICIAHMHLIYWAHDCMVFSFILSPSYHLDCMELVKLYEVWESLSGHLSFLDSYFYWWVVPWPSFEELLMFDNFTLKEIRTDLFQPRLANTFTVTPILTVPFSSVMLLPWLWPTFIHHLQPPMIKVTRSQWQQGTLLAENYHWFSFTLGLQNTFSLTPLRQ